MRLFTYVFKEVCVFPMVIWSKFRIGQFSHSTLQNYITDFPLRLIRPTQGNLGEFVQMCPEPCLKFAYMSEFVSELKPHVRFT